MGQLEDVWKDSNEMFKSDDLIDKELVLNLYERLRKEQSIQEKYRPWLVPYVLLIGFVLLMICYYYSPQDFQVAQLLGVLIIFFGGLYFMLLLSKIKWFSEAYDFNQTASSFYESVFKRLTRKRKNQKAAIYILHASLTLGLHCMIFGFKISDQSLMILLLFYGFMITLAVITIPKTMDSFDDYYLFISEKYEMFVKEPE